MSNSSATATASASGIGFGGLLTIAFIVLKLCHVIDWSWLWVLSPLWISVGLTISILLIALLIAFIVLLFKKK
jgi:hypothetical protein